MRSAVSRWGAVSIVLLVAMASVPAPSRADNASALAAYKAGEYAKAMAEWLALAQRGDARAQWHIGLEYRTGKIVPLDYLYAARWLRRSAEQGYTDAMVSLGHMYRAGNGLARDMSEALRWWNRAAEASSAVAMINLGIHYERLLQATHNYVEAYKWYNLAAASDDEAAAQGRLSRRLVAAKMTRSQIDEAQRLAREWQEEHLR